MKKLIIILLLAAGVVAYFYVSKNDSKAASDSIAKNSDTTSLSSELNATSASKRLAKKAPLNKLEELEIALKQCKERKFDFGSEVTKIHQVLLDALEYELRNGKTFRDLLAYAGQYRTYYSGYTGLLTQAKMNIEKEKYNFTQSLDILSEWRGLGVIDNFSAQALPELIQSLKPFENISSGLNVQLEIGKQVSKTDILALLDNDTDFNTYLKSPLNVTGSPVLSPSILFVATAQNLEIEEFRQAVAAKSFNVNDISIAIINDLPYEYLEPLIKQATDLDEMPILVQNRGSLYLNLADIASATHNVALLELLEDYGVTPTNEPGIITGLDLAIMNLPTEREAGANSDDFYEKYINTISYLVKRSYRAHGVKYVSENEKVIEFKAPNSRSFYTSQTDAASIKKALANVELIDESYHIEQIQPDNSKLSVALAEVEQMRVELTEKSNLCESIQKELVAEQGFLDKEEAYKVIKKVAQEGSNTAQRLHDIDPVLVNFWRDTLPSSRFGAIQENNFIMALQSNNYSEALEYSATTALSESETDALLYQLTRDVKNVMPVWDARLTHTPPTSLINFKYLSYSRWQALEAEGFDLTITDKYGNDLFLPAALNSPQTVKLLLDLGLTPKNSGLGVDSLDLSLEQSFKDGKLSDSLILIAPEIEHIEPNHYSRIARIKKFYPEQYTKLVQISERFAVHEEVELNQYQLYSR